MRWRLLPSGERAVLVELPDLDAVLALDGALADLAARGEQPWAGLIDRVPAARTLLLVSRTSGECQRVRASLEPLLAGLAAGISAPGLARTIVIPVRYDGPDLAEVAEQTGLSPAEVVTAHTRTPWRVGFVGFAPGFAYLVGGDPRLVVARRAQPRTVVPPGSVGLAGAFSGIYPRASPGGWQLIGQTDAVLWDVERDPPALLVPASLVQFVDAEA